MNHIGIQIFAMLTSLTFTLALVLASCAYFSFELCMSLPNNDNAPIVSLYFGTTELFFNSLMIYE